MNKKFVVFLIASLICLGAYFGNVSFLCSQVTESPALFLNDVLIDQSGHGDTITQRHSLKIQNLGTTRLYEVRAILRKVPDYMAIMEGEVTFDMIASGDTVAGSGEFVISIDTAKRTSDTEFVWEIIYKDVEGNLNETVVTKAIDLP